MISVERLERELGELVVVLLVEDGAGDEVLVQDLADRHDPLHRLEIVRMVRAGLDDVGVLAQGGVVEPALEEALREVVLRLEADLLGLGVVGQVREEEGGGLEVAVVVRLHRLVVLPGVGLGARCCEGGGGEREDERGGEERLEGAHGHFVRSLSRSST
ncbi:MAG: hypothetical protein QM765_05970 [Myxococcales bacterium]